MESYYDEIYSMFIKGLEKGQMTGISIIDDKISWELSRLAVVTGIPGHGKSEFIDFIVARLNIMHGWKVAYFSPENYPIKYHYSKIASKLTGKEFKQGYIEQDEFEDTFEYISNNFFFIFPEEDMSFESIISRAKYLVRKHGIKALVIDPYNKIEHLRERNESETEYISRFLDKLTNFAKQYNVIIFLIAHPRKMEKDSAGSYVKPNLYDISGSAHFYNKCDYGISVYRNFSENSVQIDFIKIKFKHLGEGGMINMRYNYTNGRFESIEKTYEQWDNKSYIRKEESLPTEEYILQPNYNFTNECPF